MKAPEEVLVVWRKFDAYPMETLTKVWHGSRAGRKKQREVAQMKEHRERYGITGNCFDLAIWLLAEFEAAGIAAYPVGSGFGTEGVHAAVMAEDGKGRRFLCDLGDQWIQPVLMEAGSPDFTQEKLSGFFPGAEVEVKRAPGGMEVVYHRPNGKSFRQLYALEPVSRGEFLAAAEYSQNHIHPEPLVEVRLPYGSETAHWEFDNWNSFMSTGSGLFPDEPLHTVEQWAERIHEKTAFDQAVLLESLQYYWQLR